jgi:MFS family permease
MMLEPPPPVDHVSRATRATLLSCALFTLLTGASISPALPAIRTAFASEPNAELLTKLVMTVSPLFIAIGGLISGWIIDRWRRRPVLIVSIVTTALFGASGALLDSLHSLIAARALLGLAVAGVTNTCYTLMVDYFEGTERQRFMGLQAAVQKIGGLVFVILGGILATYSWRATFAVDLIALLVLPGVLLAIPEPTVRRRVDRAAGERLDLRVVVTVWCIGFIGQAVFFTIPTQLPFVVTDRLDGGPAMAAAAVAISTIFSAVTATLYHRIKARLGFQTIFALIAALVAGSFGFVSRAETIPALLLGLAVGGVGFGLLLPNMTVWLMDGAPQALRGRAIGILMTAMFLGQFASPLLAQPLLQAGGPSMLFGTIAMLLALVAPVFLIAGRRPPPAPALGRH